MPIRNLAFLIAVFACCAAAAAEPTDRVVHVSGQGVVEIEPDQVVVQMTLTTVDDDLIRVRENSDKDARAILDDAKKYGAEEKGYHVSRLQLSLEYNEQLRRQIYNLERDVTVELNDLTKLDRFLLDLLREPNLKVKSITFTTSKIRQLESQALERAVADARQTAQRLAALNGLKLGKARDIRVSSESETPFVISVVPVVGSTQKKSPQRGIAGKQGRAEDLRGVGGKPLTGTGFMLVAAESINQQGDKQGDGKGEKKPFAVGMMSVTTNVQIDYDMHE